LPAGKGGAGETRAGAMPASGSGSGIHKLPETKQVGTGQIGGRYPTKDKHESSNAFGHLSGRNHRYSRPDVPVRARDKVRAALKAGRGTEPAIKAERRDRRHKGVPRLKAETLGQDLTRTVNQARTGATSATSATRDRITRTIQARKMDRVGRTRIPLQTGKARIGEADGTEIW
jgi:hypothetical protein